MSAVMNLINQVLLVDGAALLLAASVGLAVGLRRARHAPQVTGGMLRMKSGRASRQRGRS